MRKIYITAGTQIRQMTHDLLVRADLASLIGNRHAKIGVKPNLVVAKPADSGATTHPEIIAGILDYLQENGFDNLEVLEGSWVGDRTGVAVRTSGILQVCQDHDVPFYDLQKDSSTKVRMNGYELNICNRALALDWLINVPVMKGHCQTNMTCALKNHKGLIPNSEKRRFHSLGLMDPIAHLGAYFKNEYVVVDNICGDLDFEEGGNPVVMDRVFCGDDPVMIDAFVCKQMGFRLSDVPYVAKAARLRGSSTDLDDVEVEVVNDAAVVSGTRPTGAAKRLARYTDPKDACSACFGALIHALKRMDEDGRLPRGVTTPICIGQGYQGQGGKIGVGRCTKLCDRHLGGCPPAAGDIYDFLCDNW